MKKYFKVAGRIALYFLIYFMTQIISAVILRIGFVLFYGASNNSHDNIQELITGSIYITVIPAAIISIVLYSILLKNKEENFKQRCKFNKITLKESVYTIILALCLGLLSGSFILLTENIFRSYNDLSQKLAANLNSIPGIITIVILVPFIEEIVFRGLIFNELRNNINIVAAIIIQAIIFAIAHGNPAQGIYAFLVGVMASLVYIWTKSIFSNILLHIIFNLSGSFIFPTLLYYTEKYIAIYVIIGITLLVLFTVLFNMNCNKKLKIQATI